MAHRPGQIGLECLMLNSIWLSVLSLYLDNGSQNCNYLTPLLLFDLGQQIALDRSTFLYYHCWSYNLEQRCNRRIPKRYRSTLLHTKELPRVQQVYPHTISFLDFRYKKQRYLLYQIRFQLCQYMERLFLVLPNRILKCIVMASRTIDLSSPMQHQIKMGLSYDGSHNLRTTSSVSPYYQSSYCKKCYYPTLLLVFFQLPDKLAACR